MIRAKVVGLLAYVGDKEAARKLMPLLITPIQRKVGTEPCPQCKATGFYGVDGDMCRTCEGSGRITKRKTCRGCDGTGMHNKVQAGRICEDCCGTGKVPPDGTKIVPCGTYGCKQPRYEKWTFCQSCEREYHEDPDAFK